MIEILVMIRRMMVETIMVQCIWKQLKWRWGTMLKRSTWICICICRNVYFVAPVDGRPCCKDKTCICIFMCMCIWWHLKMRDHVAKTNSACMRTNWNAELGRHQVDSQDLVIIQTWNLSKNLHDWKFQGKKFTQKTRNFRHLFNRDKKCVNALNWDKTSKKCS